jgi:GT2 family glycosyltransferase
MAMGARAHPIGDDAIGPPDDEGWAAEPHADGVTPRLDEVEAAGGRFAFTSPRTVTVVICAYTERRLDSLARAVASLHAQRRPPDQVIVVIDHNEELQQRARAVLPIGVEVRASTDTQGLSGARNTGIRLACSDVVAFLDDDAEADAGWLEQLLNQYRTDVAGTGALVIPIWPGEERPRWFPREFDWVVGCSYLGLPTTVMPQRNPIGAAMSFRRSVFDSVGYFDTDMGRFGSTPLGCEETEFAIRLRRILAGVQLLHVPGAVVHHHVAAERTRVSYFVRRCYGEGLSKALVAQRAARQVALSSERRYVISTLPRGVLRGLASGLRGDGWGIVRSAMICLGLLASAVGYVVGNVAAPTRVHPRLASG